jgi:hypothetical protein
MGRSRGIRSDFELSSLLVQRTGSKVSTWLQSPSEALFDATYTADEAAAIETESFACKSRLEPPIIRPLIPPIKPSCLSPCHCWRLLTEFTHPPVWPCSYSFLFNALHDLYSCFLTSLADQGLHQLETACWTGHMRMMLRYSVEP